MGRRPLRTKEDVLVALQRLTARHGRQPSVEELRQELGVGATRTVFRYLQTLEGDGAIERRPGAPGVKLVKPLSAGVQTRAVPIVGRVPAGSSMLAEENIEGWIQIPKAMASPPSDKFFLLTVRGTSMNRATIKGDRVEDGDLILVRYQQTARSGDIIVGIVDGNATVKRFVTAPGYCILKPDSSDRTHRPIVVRDDFRVIGKVTHVFKNGSDLLRVTFDTADTT